MKKNFLLLISVIALATLVAGCVMDATGLTEELAPSPIPTPTPTPKPYEYFSFSIGRWTSDCVAHGSVYEQAVLVDTVKYNPSFGVHTFADPICQVPLYSTDIRINYSATYGQNRHPSTNSVNGFFAVQLLIFNWINVTPTTAEVAVQFNKDAACGHTDWLAESSINVLGNDCEFARGLKANALADFRVLPIDSKTMKFEALPDGDASGQPFADMLVRLGNFHCTPISMYGELLGCK